MLEYSKGMRLIRVLASKALTLGRNKPLDFTSLSTSSVRENLIRKLVWPGLLYIPDPDDIANTPGFIRDTIDSLDTLSISEMERRLYIS